MSIREILGADDFPLAARYATFQLLGKGLVPAVNQGAASANTGAVAISGRNWMKITGHASPYLQGNLTAFGITPAEMKARKIYGGFRYVIQGNAATKTADQILGINIIGPSLSYTLLKEDDMQRTTDEIYVKFLIDVAALSMTVWIDGTLVRTMSLGASANTLTDIRISYGQATGAVTSEIHCYNDFYWEVDTFDLDGEQAGKIGPVKVKTVKVQGTTLPAGWTVSDGSNPDTVLDSSTMAPSTELTPVVKTSPDESVASIGFAKPTAELAIKAVSIEVFAYRDTGTAPTIEAQVKQGAQTQTKKNFSVPTLDYNRGASSNRLGCLTKDLNGVAWTNDSIDALEVLVNSKTGS
ncbi:hypothetical protein D3C78_786360 [compost metagenome]